MEKGGELEEQRDIPGEGICTTWLKLCRLHEVHTGLTVEGTLNISCVLENLLRLFKTSVDVLFFYDIAPFLLSSNFFPHIRGPGMSTEIGMHAGL